MPGADWGGRDVAGVLRSRSDRVRAGSVAERIGHQLHGGGAVAGAARRPSGEDGSTGRGEAGALSALWGFGGGDGAGPADGSHAGPGAVAGRREESGAGVPASVG